MGVWYGAFLTLLFAKEFMQFEIQMIDDSIIILVYNISPNSPTSFQRGIHTDYAYIYILVSITDIDGNMVTLSLYHYVNYRLPFLIRNHTYLKKKRKS